MRPEPDAGRDASAETAGGGHRPGDGREALPVQRVSQVLEAVHHLAPACEAARVRHAGAAAKGVRVRRLPGERAHPGHPARARQDGTPAKKAEKHGRVPVVPVRLVRQALARPAHQARARVRRWLVIRVFDPSGARELVRRVPLAHSCSCKSVCCDSDSSLPLPRTAG